MALEKLQGRQDRRLGYLSQFSSARRVSSSQQPLTPFGQQQKYCCICFDIQGFRSYLMRSSCYFLLIHPLAGSSWILPPCIVAVPRSNTLLRFVENCGIFLHSCFSCSNTPPSPKGPGRDRIENNSTKKSLTLARMHSSCQIAMNLNEFDYESLLGS